MVQTGKKRKIFDNRYEILSIVGRGAASVVYHARNISGGSGEVALKVLLNDKEQRSSGEKLRKEALALVSSKHKYVVRLDDFHSVGELCYLSMEFAPESDLRKYSSKSGNKLTPLQAELYLLQISEALAYIHRAGIVHRDIKPDNILVISPKEVRLADFGVAVLPGDTTNLQDLQKGIGTMDYMAPEVLEGKSYTAASDIYSLGLCFYEMLSGQHPFANASMVKQLEVRKEGNFPALSSIAPQVPAYLANAIMQTLAYDPSTRLSSAKDLVQAILIDKASSGVLPANSSTAANQVTKQTAGTPSTTPSTGIGSSLLDAQRARQSGPTQASKSNTSSSDKDTNVLTQSILSSVASKTTPAEAPAEMSATATVVISAPATTPAPSAPTQRPSLIAAAKALVAKRPELMPSEPPIVPQTETAVSENKKATQVITRDLVQQVRQGMGQETVIASVSQAQRANTSSIVAAALSTKQPVANDKASIKSEFLNVSKLDRKRATFLTSSSFLLLLLLYYGNIFLIKNYNIGIAKSYLVPESVRTRSPLPSYVDQPFNFPFLPAGVYSGQVSGLVGDQATPFTVISLEAQRKVVLIVGLAGWKPAIASLPTTGSDATSLRVTSNGLVFEMTGKNEAGNLSGTLTNLITGIASEWQIRPNRS